MALCAVNVMEIPLDQTSLTNTFQTLRILYMYEWKFSLGINWSYCS